MMGFVLALPVLTYQLIAFVLPALLPHEKKYLYMALPWSRSQSGSSSGTSW
jgi:sec-independent protein translocase protein TatC